MILLEKEERKLDSKSKGVLALVLALVILANIGIFYKMHANKDVSNADVIVVRIGHTTAENNPIHEALAQFEKELEESSNGRFDVRIYPNSSLGGDRQEVESAILGYIQGCLPPNAILSGFDTRFMVSDLPFVYQSGASAMAALNGELGDELNPILDDMGLHSMGWTESGFRYITSNDLPVTSPDDLKGLSIRTMENPIHVASFKAWGANPTPMAFSELFTALQQGAVDAQENPIIVSMSSRFFEVQNTLSLTGHFYSAGTLVFNKDFYESLKGEDKKLFDEASEHCVKNLTEMVWDQNEEFIQTARDEGMNVVEVTPEQKAVFRDAASNVYQLYIEQYGGSQELIDKAMMYNDDFE